MNLLDEMSGHDDGVTHIAFANNMMYTGSYDHSIRSWDLGEMNRRIWERRKMYYEDLNVRNL